MTYRIIAISPEFEEWQHDDAPAGVTAVQVTRLEGEDWDMALSRSWSHVMEVFRDTQR